MSKKAFNSFKAKWKRWRKKVFKRDKYTCQLCGKKGGEIHPHHIVSKLLFPERKFFVGNGITLCYKCHLEKNVHADKNNRYVTKFSKITKLKPPKEKPYHVKHSISA